MDTIVERTLIANGIFQSDRNQLRCLICTTNANFVDWKKHIEESTHIRRLQCFKLSFSLNSEMIECKICEKSFPWMMLEAHGKLHKIVPWYIPIDKYKIFYENHILEWDKQFYCYPCDIFFPEWSTAFVHTDNERHKNLVKMEVPSNDLSSWNEVDIPYELLVNEGFVTWGSTTFKCTICNCPKIGLKNVHQHVSGDQHGHLKIRFIRELRGWKNSKINSPIAKESAPLTIAPCMYVMENSPTSYDCKICNIEFFDRSSVDNHANGISHINALKKYGCDNIFVKDKNYHCGCCDSSILGMINVSRHVKEITHKNNMSIVGPRMNKVIINDELTDRESNDKKYKNEPDCPPSDCIVMVNHEKFCKLCNCTINGDFDHIAGDKHLTSLREFRKNVTMTENYTEYHCKFCDCKILGIDNLFRHLNGNRHANCLNKLNRQEEIRSNDDEINKIEREIEVEEIQQVEKNPSKLVAVNLCYDHIFKINNDSLCKICDCKISQPDVDAHVIGSEHEIAVQEFRGSVTLMKNDKYRCKNCNCTIRGIDNVYLHIHGNRHKKDKEEDPKKKQKSVEKIAKNVELDAKETKAEKINSDDSLEQNFGNKRNDVSEELVRKENTSELETVYKNSNDSRNKEIDHNSRYNGPHNGVFHDDNMNNVTAKFKCFNLDCGKIIAPGSDPENLLSSINGRKRILPYEGNIQRVLELFDFDNDFIHNMRDKLKEVELGMKFCFLNDSKKIYCLICRQEVTEEFDNYIEHLWSLDHCEYLEGMEKDHDLFEVVPDQYSELDLASHYMEEISEEAIICHACDKEIDNMTHALRDHIINKIHVRKCEEMHLRARKNFETIKSRIQCDWYKIYNYQCVPCSANFQSEFNFANHLKNTGHERVMKNFEKNEKFIYDFCEICGLLWYGKRCTYANHCKMAHKSLITRDEETKLFVPENIRCAMKNSDVPGTEKKEKNIIRDVENELSIEEKKIIKFFNDSFPCGKLLLLLEETLKMYDLSGSERITTYTLYWYMIFFLQRESIVPSVAALKTEINEITISGWKNESRNTHNVESFSIEKFFIRFFAFYANFDYHYNVACPLLGEVVKKRSFADPENHFEMKFYIDFLKKSDDSETFQIDSPMCIQDPFDLLVNLTQSLSKVELNDFRTCCAKTLNALEIDL